MVAKTGAGWYGAGGARTCDQFGVLSLTNPVIIRRHAQHSSHAAQRMPNCAVGPRARAASPPAPAADRPANRPTTAAA